MIKLGIAQRVALNSFIKPSLFCKPKISETVHLNTFGSWYVIRAILQLDLNCYIDSEFGKATTTDDQNN